MKKRDFYKILFLICFWECCVIFISVYDASVVGFKSEIKGEYYSFWRVLVSAMTVCLIGATILGSIEVLVLGKLLRKKALGISLLLKTIIYLTFIFFFTSLATLYVYSLEINRPMFSDEVFRFYKDYFLNVRVFATILYWGFEVFWLFFF